MASPGEWTELCKKQFALLDIDGSGVIHQEELHKILAKLDQSWTWENSLALFQEIDANVNGEIDYDEFIDWVSGAAGESKDIGIDMEDALGSLRKLAERWCELGGQPPGPRSVVSGEFRVKETAEASADSPIAVTITTLDGRSERLSDLKTDEMFGNLLKIVSSLFGFDKVCVQLLLGASCLGLREEQVLLKDLDIVNGSQLTCVVVSMTDTLETSTISDYILGPMTYDEDCWGHERLATYQKLGTFFSMKIISKQQIMRMRMVRWVIKERRVLQSFNHPFIRKLHASFQNSTNLYLLSEYCPGGDVYDLFKRSGRFQHNSIRFYLAIVVLAIEYLHSLQFLYRSLKLENMLITEDGYLKLRDFSLGKSLPPGLKTYTQKITAEYVAPEVLLDQGYDHKVDWWSIGIINYEMFVGRPPFTDPEATHIYLKVLGGKIYYPKYMPKSGRQVTKSCCVRADRRCSDAQAARSWKIFEGMDFAALADRALPAPWVPKLENAGDLQYYSVEEPPQPTPEPPYQDAAFASW